MMVYINIKYEHFINKRRILLLTFLIMSIVSSYAQSGPFVDAIHYTASYLIEQIPPRSNVAIINIEANKIKVSNFVIEEMTEFIINHSTIRVVERRNFEPLMKEMKFGMSGYVDDESAQKIGHMLGAQIIISGVVTSLNYETLRLQIKAITVETAVIVGMRNENINISKDKTYWAILGYINSPFKNNPNAEIDLGLYLGGGPNNNNKFVFGVNSQLGIIQLSYNSLGWLLVLDGGIGIGVPYLYDYYAGGLVGICIAGGDVNIGLGGGISTGSIPYLRGILSTYALEVFNFGLYFDYVFSKGSIEQGYKIGAIAQLRLMHL